MKINRIVFSNYRCFLDGEISFKTDDKKNMTVLIGPNGGGKTETLFAFWWALYDFDFSKLTNKENTPYALNSNLYRELEQSPVGSTKKCSVVLEFEENDTEYVVKKWCEYKKTDKQIRMEEFREFSYYLNNGELSLPIRDAELINKKLNRIIPKTILYGIIFDGERMQKLNTVDENSTNAIKGVISDITNVELLEKCSEYFSSIKRKLNKDLKNEDKKSGNLSLDEIINQLETKESEQKKFSQMIEEYSEEQEQIDLDLERISNELEKISEVKEIEKERKTQRDSLAKYEKNLDTFYKNFSATLRDGYLIASEKLLIDVENIIKKYDVPQDLTVPAVKNILKRQKCICGREMDHDAIDALNRLIGILPPDNINSTLSEIVRQIRQRISDVKEQAKQNYELITNCEADIKKCKESIASLSTRITSMTDNQDEDIQKAIELEKENKRLLMRKGFLKTEIPSLANDVSELDSEIKRLRDMRKDSNTSSSAIVKINSQLSYIEKCLHALDRIKDINKGTALREINEMISKAYELLSEDAERGRKIRIIQHNKDRKYQIAVYMDEDFNKLLNAWKNDGTYEKKISQGLSDEEIEEELIVGCVDSNSTGQSKINTFAFVKAILDYSNSPKSEDGIEIRKDYPLLIDAPFGDISAGNLIKSSTELHTFAKQVILMIDEDKYLALRKAFDPYTSQAYVYLKADNSNYSTIALREE